MNRKKWSNPQITLPTLALKLCEEAGEVANAITDAQFADGAYRENPSLTRKQREALTEELDHVIFIATMMHRRISG